MNHTQFEITSSLAEYIKRLRMAGYTWRSIDKEVATKYPDLCNHLTNLGIPAGQMRGKYLCDHAMSFLNESEEDWDE